MGRLVPELAGYCGVLWLLGGGRGAGTLFGAIFETEMVREGGFSREQVDETRLRSIKVNDVMIRYAVGTRVRSVRWKML